MPRRNRPERWRPIPTLVPQALPTTLDELLESYARDLVLAGRCSTGILERPQDLSSRGTRW